MANKDNQLFDIPDPEAAGWKEDPDRPGYWLWEADAPVTEAPEDGKQYGRQDADWTEIVVPSALWQGNSGGISTNASKAIVGQENTEGAGLYASGSIRVWETSQNNNYLWSGYGAGSVTSFIQADGDAKFAGNVDLLGVGRYGRASFGFNTDEVFPRNNRDLSVSGAVDLGSSTVKWKDGWFGGTVSASQIDSLTWVSSDENAQLQLANGRLEPMQAGGLAGTFDLGSTSFPWRNGVFSGKVVADSFELSDGSPIGGGGGASSWTELTDKPSEFPPEYHTHPQSEVEGLETRLTSIENQISSGGSSFSGDYNDLTNKPTIPTNNNQLVNGMGYATQTWVSNNYASQYWVSTNYQAKGTYVTTETDPTVPSWVKSITQANINSWNAAAGGGGDPFPWTGSQAVFNGSGSVSTIKVSAGGGRGPEIEWYNTSGRSKYLRLNSNSNLELVSNGYAAVVVTFTDSGLVQATDFNATSDANLKDNITTAPSEVISNLHGREWTWKESGEKGSGVVAQELEAAGLDHLVNEDSNGNKTVAYNGLVAYLIEEVKALRQEVEALKS